MPLSNDTGANDTGDSYATVGRVPDAREVADRLAIQEVLALHCRGVDRADEAALKAAYWPDAEVAYGGFEGSAHQFCELLPTSIGQFARTQHTISNVYIQFTDNPAAAHRRLAAVETYVTAYHYTAANADGNDTEMTYIGRYHDQFEHRDSLWKIRHRRVLHDWNQNAAASAIWSGPPFEGLVRGGRYPDDPLYAHFAQQKFEDIR